MKTVLFALLATVAFTATTQAAAETPSARAAIQQTLDATAKYWSAGDMDAFMRASYEHTSTVRYIGSKDVVVGYDAIAAMYTSHYKPNANADMGHLTLQLIDVQQLSPDYAMAIGRYNVTWKNGKSASGMTTLLFHRTGSQWLIALDHSS
ncbi:DUF4440 domain-containing protein [Dyella sp. 2HG41-7]|uniref:YybH family protein n=1 Tax=Dyella sp. 2HG41-7 TaxID=2883239 RepID=UPI001F31F0AA|nr:DUF4440 domain-containing protein [Dyella sp. 2HG41-7]